MKFSEIYVRNDSPSFWEEVPDDECNCGAFALDLTSWFAPYIHEDYENENKFEEEGDADRFTCYERDHRIAELIDEGYSAEEVADLAVEYDWEFILRTCPWLEPINSVEDADLDDRIIAYRLMCHYEEGWTTWDVVDDMDYHFRVRIDGVWYEKCGSGPIRKLGYMYNEADWHCGYDDSLVYNGKIKYARFKTK